MFFLMEKDHQINVLFKENLLMSTVEVTHSIFECN